MWREPRYEIVGPLLKRFLAHLFQHCPRRGIRDDLRRLIAGCDDHRRLHPLQRLNHITQQRRVQVELTNPRSPPRTVTGLLGNNRLSKLPVIQYCLVEPRRRRQLINQLQERLPTSCPPPSRQIHAVHLQEVSADLGPVTFNQLAEASPSPTSPIVEAKCSSTFPRMNTCCFHKGNALTNFLCSAAGRYSFRNPPNRVGSFIAACNRSSYSHTATDGFA